MKKISLLCLLVGLLVLLALPAAAAETSGECGDNVTWTLQNSTLTVSGTGAMYDYSDFNGTPWTDSRDQIKKVIVAEGVTTIGASAFWLLPNLTEVALPDGLITIENSAFNSCDSIQKVEIPASVKVIKAYAFAKCGNLKEIWFRGDKPSIADHAFSKANGYLYFPTHNDTWKNISYPNDCGNLAWMAADSKEQGICGENLTWKLQGTVLTISGSGDMEEYGTRVSPPWYGSHLEITEVIVEEGVTKIGDNAFLRLENMTKVTLPKSLKEISLRAFASCYKLESINLPEGLETIMEDAFRSCKALKEIVIPASVTNTHYTILDYCTGLKKMTIMGSAPIRYGLRGEEIWFYGDAPDIQGTYAGEKGTAYYPADNITWTKDKMVDFDGRLTWVPFGCSKHTEVTDAAVAAGCLTAGKTAGAHCSKCGVVTKPQQVIPATGHSFGDWKQTKAPTTQAVGQETRSCKNCSAVEQREIPKLTQQNPNPTDPKPTEPSVQGTMPPTVSDETQPDSTQTQPTEPDATSAVQLDTQPATPDDAPEKGTPWLTIAVVGALILAGGGAAAWFFVLRKRK